MFGLCLFGVGCFQFLISLDPCSQDFQTFLLLRFDLFRDPLHIILVFFDPILHGQELPFGCQKGSFLIIQRVHFRLTVTADKRPVFL